MNQYNADTGQEEDQYVKRFKALFPTLHKHPMEFNNVNYQLQIATYKGVQYLDFLLRDAHLNTKLHATSLPGDKDYNTWYIEVALNSIYNSIRTSDNFNSKLSKTFTRNQRDWYSDGNLVWMYETQTQNSIFDIEFNKNVKESKKMVKKKITESELKVLIREAVEEAMSDAEIMTCVNQAIDALCPFEVSQEIRNKLAQKVVTLVANGRAAGPGDDAMRDASMEQAKALANQKKYRQAVICAAYAMLKNHLGQMSKQAPLVRGAYGYAANKASNFARGAVDAFNQGDDWASSGRNVLEYLDGKLTGQLNLLYKIFRYLLNNGKNTNPVKKQEAEKQIVKVLQDPQVKSSIEQVRDASTLHQRLEPVVSKLVVDTVPYEQFREEVLNCINEQMHANAIQENRVRRISESDLKKLIREAIEDFNLPKPNPNAKYLDEQCIELSRQLENRCKQEERRYGMNRQQMLKIATNFIGSQISRFDIPTAEYIGNLSDKASDYYSRFDAHREYVQNIDDETFNNDIERFDAIYGGNELSNEGNSFDAEENRIASSVDTAKKCLSDPNTVIIFVFYSDERVCYFLKRQDFENALRKDKAYNNDNKLTNSKLGFGTVVNKDEPKIRMSQGVK